MLLPVALAAQKTIAFYPADNPKYIYVGNSHWSALVLYKRARQPGQSPCSRLCHFGQGR
jgi:hypothetical protein